MSTSGSNVVISEVTQKGMQGRAWPRPHAASLAADTPCSALEMLRTRLSIQISCVEKHRPQPERGRPFALGSSHLYTPGRCLWPMGSGQQGV